MQSNPQTAREGLEQRLCSLEGCNTPYKGHAGRGLCRTHYGKWLRDHNPSYRNNVYKAGENAARHHDKVNFGGQREEIIQRDGEKCVKCGMTRAEHKKKWGYDLCVDHIDGRGRRKPAEQKNNDPSNLQTLCSHCHSQKDNPRRKLTESQVINIRHCKGSINGYELGELYGVSGTAVYNIWNGVTWAWPKKS